MADVSSHEYILVAMVIVQSGLVLTFLRDGNEQSMHKCFFNYTLHLESGCNNFSPMPKTMSDDISVLSQLV